MSLSPVDLPSEFPTLPTTSGYRRGTRMSLSPPNPSTQLDSQVAAESSTKQVYKICGIEVAEYDEEEEVLKILGVVWSEKEEEDFFRRTGIRKEDIDRSRTLSCVEWGWGFLNLISSWLAFMSFHILVARLSIIYDTHFVAIFTCSTPLIFGLGVLMLVIQRSCLGMPFRLIGRVGRIVADGIALVVAFILREAFPYDGSERSIYALLLLVNLTLYLLSWLKVVRRADDISLSSVLLEMIVQALIYMSTGHDIMCFFIVSFFCGVMYYKYVSYSVPFTLEDKKKDLDSLPV